MKRKVRVGRSATSAAAVLALIASGPWTLAAQTDLADFDYENLAFRGVGFDVGYLVPDRVESAVSYGLRVDLGYLGPSFRLVPHAAYWKSPLEASEVRDLEDKLETLIRRELEPGAPVPDVALGVIDWSGFTLGLDGHFVWSIPAARLLTFAGAGAALHVMNGSGDAINKTFVEDLLDSWSAGINVHSGIEVPVTERLRIYGTGKYQIQGDLRYFDFRVGAQVMFGESLAGERDGS